MTNICPTCTFFNKMNRATKALSCTLIIITLSVIAYFTVPQVIPGGYVLVMFVPFLIAGLLFGLVLFGFAFGISKLCERIKGK